MWNKLDHQKKNLLSIAGMVLCLYIAYVFSFRHTIAALQLNRQLKKEQGADQSLTNSSAQVSRKNNFYANAVKSYTVKKEDRENRLWQAVSGMALAQNVNINFNPKAQFITDSLALQKGLVTQQFAFKGDYFNLVKLLDTMGKSRGIGKIYDLKLFTKKENADQQNKSQLKMELTLAAIAR